MPGAGFKTFTAGEVFTATDANTYLMQQAVMVFTNEAARDAAITSPSEGMHAYLTAPTIPAATGGTTAIPSGVLTVYNGSVWVCVTPISGYISTGETRANSAFGDLATVGPSVTLVTGTTALISFSIQADTAAASRAAVTAVAVSGATTRAADEDYGITITGGTNLNLTSTRTFIATGLTAGTNTFTLKYRTDGAGSTCTWYRRQILGCGVA